MWTARNLTIIGITAGFLVSCIENKQEDLATYRAKIIGSESNGSIWGVPNGGIWGVPNGGIWGVPNGVIWGVPNGNGWGVSNGNGWGVSNGNGWGVSNGTAWAWIDGQGFPNGTCTTKDGQVIDGLSLTGSLLKGTVGQDKKSVSGTKLIGTTCKILSSDSAHSLYLRFDDVVLDNAYPPANDVWQYLISGRVDSARTWAPLCLDEAGKVADYLVPIQGSGWDITTGARFDNPGAITLACRAGAIGKCARVGYRPWATGTACRTFSDRKCSQVSLKDHHQACTRMLRADYCGNGQSYTVNGTVLEIMDYLQPLLLLDEDKWQIESRWVPNGATCLTQPRHPELWPGGCPNPNGAKSSPLVKLPRCAPFEVVSGLIVSSLPSKDD